MLSIVHKFSLVEVREETPDACLEKMIENLRNR